MKKIIILIISNLLIANVVTNNAAITIDSGVTVTINGDFQNTGSIVNEGAIYLIGQYDHNDDDGVVGTIAGSGIFSLCDQPKELDEGANLISFYALPGEICDSPDRITETCDKYYCPVGQEGCPTEYGGEHDPEWDDYCWCDQWCVEPEFLDCCPLYMEFCGVVSTSLADNLQKRKRIINGWS